MTSPEAFFAYARERQAILLRRRADLPGPWTEDGILQTYRFCNVFREDDRVTIWFRENVREKVDPNSLIAATAVFRWFNRIKTGEAIFLQPYVDGKTAWEHFLDGGDTDRLHHAITTYIGPKGPYVTGSYIIKTPDGMTKLDGVLWSIRKFITLSKDMAKNQPLDQGELNRYMVRRQKAIREWDEMPALLRKGDRPEQITMEEVWYFLRQFPYLGDFMAYEIVTDLDQTFRFPDRMTWANPGPGAARGLGRLYHGDKDYFNTRMKKLLNGKMQELLAMSQDVKYWPQDNEHGMSIHMDHWTQSDTIPPSGTSLWGWPQWDMRTVEHTLCEFDKYERVRTGEGRPRQLFRQ